MDEKKYYSDVAYNRSKRNKFYITLMLLVVCMGLAVGTMVAIQQYIFAIFFLVIIVLMFTLIPSVHKNYPLKESEPALLVKGKDIFCQGKELKAADIERVIVNVPVAPISKLDSENKEYLKETASAYPEEEVFGTLDIELKAGLKAKKGEVLYLSINDCLGALTSLVSAGVKHYVIGFSMKKYYESAQFTITKNETKKQAGLSEVSQKDRLKQLL